MEIQVISVYINILNRFPDPQAYHFFKEKSAYYIERSIVISDEFKMRFVSPLDFLYRCFLNRQPDDDGAQTYKGMDYFMIKNAILNSNEYNERKPILETKFQKQFPELNFQNCYSKALLSFGNSTISPKNLTKYLYFLSNSLYKKLIYVSYKPFTKNELVVDMITSSEIPDYKTESLSFNPSIQQFQTKKLCACRRIMRNGVPVNWFEVNSNEKCCGEISMYCDNELVYKETSKVGKYFMNGWEDIKLFVHQQNIYALVNFRDEENIFKYFLFVFDEEYNLKSKHQLQISDKYIEQLDQKNWNLFWNNNELKVHIMLNPKIIGTIDFETFKISVKIDTNVDSLLECYSMNCICAQPNSNNFLGIIHKQIRSKNVVNYVHRFVYLSENLSVKSISKPFKFTDSPIEFPMGMYFEFTNLNVSCGYNDADCKFLNIEKNVINDLFENISHVRVKNTEFSIFVHEDDYISNTIKKFGCWEPEISNLIHEICSEKSPSFIVDIGANIGYYSLLCASLGHEVVAFEPMPYNYDLLTSSIHFNKNFKIHAINEAVTDVNDSLQLKYNLSNKGGCSLRHNFEETTTNPDDALEVVKDVSCRTFDSYEIIKTLCEKYRQILFMKIDVEGHETKVVSTILDLFEKKLIKHCLIEISPDFTSIYDYAILINSILNLKYNAYDCGSLLQGNSNKFTKKHVQFKNYKEIVEFVQSIQKRPDRQTNILFQI